MSIPDLIELLTADTKPVQRHAYRRIIWPSLSVGTLCAFVAMMLSIGLRPSLHDGDVLSQSMIRAGIGLISVTAGLAALIPSLRPDLGSAMPKRILGITSLALVTVAALQFAAPYPSWSILYLGASVVRSPWMIPLLAIPPFIALTFAVRSEAPTHLNVTGAALGLTSGGVGAAIYALSCNEGSMSFCLAWFSLGIGLTTFGGMLVTPSLLRW